MERQKDACRLKSNLVYLFSKFKVSQGYIVTLCLNKQKPKPKTQNRKTKQNLKRKKGRQARRDGKNLALDSDSQKNGHR